jgi:hypothetical protein
VKSADANSYIPMIMKRDTLEFFTKELEYRQKNNIKGKCYYFNTKIPPNLKNHAYKSGILCPSGLCLYTNKNISFKKIQCVGILCILRTMRKSLTK